MLRDRQTVRQADRQRIARAGGADEQHTIFNLRCCTYALVRLFVRVTNDVLVYFSAPEKLTRWVVRLCTTSTAVYVCGLL